MSKLRRSAGVFTLAAVAVLTLQVGVLAQDVTIEIPLDTVIRGPEGSQHHVGSASVPPDFQGAECGVVARVENQGSVHPGNDLVISSGGDTLVLADVEGESYGSVAGEGSLTLGDQVDVVLILGADGVFSAGFDIEITCPEPAPTTTTTSTSVPDTTTSVPETTVPPTTMPEITTTSTVPTTVLGTSTSTTVGPDASSTSTTVGPTSTSEPPSTLPFTGSGPDAPTWAAVASVLFGLGLLVVTSSYEKVDRR